VQESLEEAWAIALAVDPWLQAKQFKIDAARSQWRAAVAESYPWLDVGTNYLVRDNEPAFVFSGQPFLPGNIVSPYAQREGLGYFASFSLPIYTGGAVPAEIDAAAAGSSASRAEEQVARQDLRLLVAENYVGVLRAMSDAALARTTAQSLEAHAQDVELAYEQQQRPKNDFLAAQVALADARHTAIAAEHNVDAACAGYNRRLSRLLDSPVRLEDLPVPRRSAEPVESFTAAAIGGREELQQLAAQARALRDQAESLLARNRPQAALTGAYTFNENRYQTPEGIASLGVGVTWNLYDAGRDRQRACALQQQAAALDRLAADLRMRIELEVRRAWLNVAETAQRLSVTSEALAQADENVRVTRLRYAEGMGTNTDVLGAESQRMQSFRNHHHAYYDAILAEFRLRRACGAL
jgi:outer membrane protein TolC